MGWTDERVELLRKLWMDGLSASQIAKQLGEVTRNAVIGKVHRLGLSGRATPSQPAKPVFKAPRPPRPVVTAPPVQRRPVEVRPVPPPAPVVYVEERGTATVLTLGTHMCKWPIGDPATDEFTFLRPAAPAPKAPTASSTPVSRTFPTRRKRSPAPPN